jgi:hypothetical protein
VAVLEQVTSFDRAVLISRVLRRALESTPADFRFVLEKAKHDYPNETAQFFIDYISRQGLDDISKKVLPWLSREHAYLDQLLNPNVLPVEAARVALEAFRISDPQFSSKFVAFLSPNGRNVTPASLRRALKLLVGLSTYESFIPQLQVLAKHSDTRVSSIAVKALCRARPNKSLVDRYLHSDDVRVRANALEALWHVKTDDAKAVFEACLGESDHRVVLNAVVGLYYLGSSRAIPVLETLAESPSDLFRRATVWALELLEDPKTRPIVVRLLSDPDQMIRAGAERTLLKLPVEPAPLPAAEETAPVSEAIQPAPEPIEAVAEAQIPGPAEEPPVAPVPDPSTFGSPRFKLL